jgi:hypothetical protein
MGLPDQIGAITGEEVSWIAGAVATLEQREQLGWVVRAPGWQEVIAEVEMTIAADRERSATVHSVDVVTLAARLRALTPVERMQLLDAVDCDQR